MTENWWLQPYVAWPVGFGIGLFSGLASNWVFYRLRKKFRRGKPYFTSTYERGVVSIEAQYSATVSTEEFLEYVTRPLRAVVKKPKEEAPGKVVEPPSPPEIPTLPEPEKPQEAKPEEKPSEKPEELKREKVKPAEVKEATPKEESKKAEEKLEETPKEKVEEKLEEEPREKPKEVAEKPKEKSKK